MSACGYSSGTDSLWQRRFIGCCSDFFQSGKSSLVVFSVGRLLPLSSQDGSSLPLWHVRVFVCVWVMWSDRRTCACVCVLCVNLGLWFVKVVCTHASVLVYSTVCVCCRLSLFKPSPSSSNPLIPVIPLSPSSLFFSIHPRFSHSLSTFHSSLISAHPSVCLSSPNIQPILYIHIVAKITSICHVEWMFSVFLSADWTSAS